MSLWFDIVRVAASLNVILLAVLLTIWGRNYLEFRSKHTLGLSLFAIFLLAENALSLYIFIVDPTLSAWFASEVPNIVWRAMMVLHVFQTIGIAFLLWVSWD